MLPEQQQRILGYFIEEAKDHLNTMEQGLLNLQNTLKDPEMVNEIFRAAHSIKGGAAMLGLTSIQRVAHRLEDCFKDFQECPQLQVDQKLESLFLRVFDTLQELVEQLEGFGLPEDVVNNLMSDVEPVFEALHQHLKLLVAGGSKQPQIESIAPKFVPVASTLQHDSEAETASFLRVFKNKVLQQLREMLEYFKQSETPKTRQQLQECCHQLLLLGKEFDLPGWCTLCETASGAIADVKNTYYTLAPIIIKQLKQAQELVLTGREAEITTSEQLQALSVATFSGDSPHVSSPDFNETLALNSVFGAQDSLLVSATEESDFADLFGASQENADLIAFWDKEPVAQAQSEIELEEFDLFEDAGEHLFGELATEPEATQAFDLDAQIENSLNEFVGEFDSTFDDLWGENGNAQTSAFDNTKAPKLESQKIDQSTAPSDFFDLGDATEQWAGLSFDLFDTGAEEITESNDLEDFGDLAALLGEEASTTTSATAFMESLTSGERDSLTGDTSLSPSSAPGASVAASKAAAVSRQGAFEQMMRVPVKQLDNVSNLVGELVVYRNSLEQDQERLRQFLDNLLHQVQQLGNVGSRMQELYEQSLLEASLSSNRRGSQSVFIGSTSTLEDRQIPGMEFDALEMDRFTGFHTLAQEIIELIVRVRESTSDIEFITEETDQVARQFRQVTNQLQEGLTRSRMVPFSQIADRLPRAVRDISLKYGKQAELHIEGRETLIDKVILEQLYDPMTHLVNNAITHGIETPEERLLHGKSSVGQITIKAFLQGNQTVISVADDGAGVDAERVKTKAIQKSLITPELAKTLSRLDVYNLLFHPGFSTKDQVDDFAGRGVGMDVVRTSLNQIQGTINTDSMLGHGTTFTIRLPLTLSICKALCCLSDKTRIAFPMDGVEQMIDIPISDVITSTVGESCISWRDSLLPFRPLKELLTYNRQLSRGNFYGGNRDDDMISIVVLRAAGTFIAVQVDQVLGEQEIVIKQFEGPAPKPVGVAGATIMGDGRIMPIADVLELIDLSMGRLQQKGSETMWGDAPVLPETPAAVKTEPMVLIVDDSITVRELLSMTFNGAGYRVEQARDGQEAWEKLCDGLPCDIVFCDIEMPRMNGLELLSRMQNNPNFSELPIAMLTSRGADRHRQMAVKLGASGYITKPYLEEALLDAAQRMLKGEILVKA